MSILSEIHEINARMEIDSLKLDWLNIVGYVAMNEELPIMENFIGTRWLHETLWSAGEKEFLKKYDLDDEYMF